MIEMVLFKNGVKELAILNSQLTTSPPSPLSKREGEKGAKLWERIYGQKK
jgi:hypothetical protein